MMKIELVAWVKEDDSAVNLNFKTELPTIDCGRETYEADGVIPNVYGIMHKRKFQANSKKALNFWLNH